MASASPPSARGSCARARTSTPCSRVATAASSHGSRAWTRCRSARSIRAARPHADRLAQKSGVRSQESGVRSAARKELWMGGLFNIDWHKIFVPDTPVLEIFLRGTLVYLALFALLRFVLKREAGTIGITD